MNKRTRYEEIALFLSVESMRDQINIEKREIERIQSLIKSIVQPTPEELALIIRVLDYRTKEVESNERLLSEMMFCYQGTDSSHPVAYPDYWVDVSLKAKTPTKAVKSKKEK